MYLKIKIKSESCTIYTHLFNLSTCHLGILPHPRIGGKAEPRKQAFSASLQERFQAGFDPRLDGFKGVRGGHFLV